MSVAPQNFPRTTLTWIAFGYTVFVIYGSLVPLEFVSKPLADAWFDYQLAYSGQWSMALRTDWFANFLLFIPLTYLWLAALWQPGRNGLNLSSSILLLAAAWALCSSIEFTQEFFPKRTVSINDIIAETSGGLFGLVCYWLSAERFRSWYSLWYDSKKDNRWRLYLELYLVVLLGYNLMPLDLSLSPVELHHKWQAGKLHLIPFSHWQGNLIELAYALLSEVIIWVPLAIFWLRAKALSATAVVLRVLAAASIIEFCQLFVLSRVSDTSDIICAGLGALVGVLLGRRMLASSSSQIQGTKPLIIGITAWALWLAGLCLVYWYPFDFDFRRSFVEPRLEHFWGVLFSSYYAGTEFTAITQILRKLSLAVPLGLATAWALRAYPRLSGLRLWALLLPSYFGLFGIELVQVLLSSKVAHQTDAWLGCLSCTFAFFAARKAFSPITQTHKVSPASAQVQPARAQQSAAKSSYWGLGLAMLACYLLLLGIGQLPGIPYNLRELLRGDVALVQAALITLSAWWLCGYPLFSVRRLAEQAPFVALPSVLKHWLLHVVSSAVLLRLGAPKESLHDVIGAPTWGTVPELEYFFRACGLLAMPCGALYVAALSISKRAERFDLKLLYKQLWIIFLVALMPLSYLSVVVFAGTDNLTELLRGAGYSPLTLSLPIYLVALAHLGLAVSRLSTQSSSRQWLLTLASFALMLPLGYWLVWLGTEPEIYKYQQVFSALQFLLSENRDNYLTSGQVMLRFAVVQTVVVIGLALLQFHRWGSTPYLAPATKLTKG